METKIFLDTGDLESIKAAVDDPRISGFTTNPSLLRQAGVRDYRSFANTAVHMTDLPLSLGVTSDEPRTIEREARYLSALAPNVYVKIPIVNSYGASTIDVVRKLSCEGLKLNITAIFRLQQVSDALVALRAGPNSVLSFFAGRLADTGRDPVSAMGEALGLVRQEGAHELLWASAREIYNYYQAASLGCDIITLSPTLVSKLELVGRGLDEMCLSTVKGFRRDAIEGGLEL